MKILLLAGGGSAEREVSFKSGENVEQALRALGHEVVQADPAAADFDLAALAKDVDVVFPILHGAGGEDGVLQQQLEDLHVKFLGSRAEASHLAFDKVEFKRLLEKHNLPTPQGQVVAAADFAHCKLAHSPFVLKPIDGGSSIDTFIVRDPSQRPEGIEAALKTHGKMLLEELIAGQEITVSVLGDEALPIVLILPPEGEEFDYENKYNGKSREIAAPDEVVPEVQREAQALALQVHEITGCRDLSRTDIMVRPDGTFSILEINTMPGLTAESLLPKAAAAAGMDMPALVARLVELAAA